MEQVPCARCGQEGEKLARAPWPGPLGETIFSHVCAACWQEWQGRSTMLINEYKLNLSEPQARETLMAEMKAFLNLPPL